MTATGHAVIGTVIAAKIGNPALAIPIAFGSHFLADMFPHWDTATHWKTKSKYLLYRDSVIDGLLAIFLIYFLSVYVFPGTDVVYAYVISFFSLLPDILTTPYLFLDWHFPPFSWFYRIQSKLNNRMDKPWGIIGQAAFLVILVLVAKLI